MENKKLRILLILPEAKIHKLKIGNIFGISFREAPLTATMLAALIPEDIDAEVRIVDESIGQRIPLNKNYDVVGISVMTGTSKRAYQIADMFKKKGSLVVLGGVHVTLLPEEAKEHADSIVIGFAEALWPKLLKDILKGQLKAVYQDEDRGAILAGLPEPRRDLQKKLGYVLPNTVLMTRGCRGTCDFCSVPAAKYGWAKRPIEDIVNEIKRIKSRRIAISDVHLTDDVEYAKKLFKALIPLKKEWGALASTRIADDPELLDLMRESGCSYLLIGFESVNNLSLNNINKGFNQAAKYKVLIENLHARDISVQGCFIFGFDEDTQETFRKTLEIVNELKIDIPRYALYTPYPKTKLFERLQKEGRILHEQWEYYDTQHVVIVPKRMTREQLDEGFKWIYKETFKYSAMLKRTAYLKERALVTFMGNLAYNIYARRLGKDLDRFPKKNSPEEVLV